ncbi:MAG: glutathione S-transferase family protein [Myxococcota bacterium]
MGMFINGTWHRENKFPANKSGEFDRTPTSFRSQISADPNAEFPAEAGRYHLYVSYACPWAHRTLITRALKGLEHAISVSVVHWYMGEDGWTFQDGPGVVADPHHRATHLKDVYKAARDDFTGRVTVPILFDTTSRQIVNNESSEIIRQLDAAFQGIAKNPDLRLSPDDLMHEIDTLNAPIYDRVNNGVYKCGFARTQAAYGRAANALFDHLDTLEAHLSTRRWMCGDRFTEADVRLFVTLLRFDPVYVTHFKCDRRRIVDYPNLWAYTREIAQVPGITKTIDMQHIRRHYFESHPSINPRGIVSVGPADADLSQPHNRERLGGRPPLG